VAGDAIESWIASKSKISAICSSPYYYYYNLLISVLLRGLLLLLFVWFVGVAVIVVGGEA
jgi:hypothetical protein